MGGMVGVSAQDTARFSMFSVALSQLQMPPDTTVNWAIGHAVASSVNLLVRDMLEDGCDWIWFMADDHVFEPQILLKLLNRRVDIVAPLCLQRVSPYRHLAFSGFAEGSDFLRERIDLSQHPNGGMVKVHSSSCAGMVVRRRVFETLTDPWFEGGKLTSGFSTEDLYFCDKAREAGFDIWCDLDASLGHLTTVTVWPVNHDGDWTFGLTMNGGFQMTMGVGTAELLEETG